MRASLALFVVTVPAVVAAPSSWIAILFCLAAILISAGYLTRIVAGLCAVACAIMIWPMTAAPPLSLFPHVLDAAALALIGPGAFSIDARLFGRRTMHLPG
ncbi:hypothetical protein IAG41_18805 [Sphingomonas sp. JC676]|uniref:hypothetical protein n=1 Tax=Sphingomonas sp. JC676 TaxID=2768065 RepID=UPI00165809CE|nr:hypothetical protein [Sphingomonas sp. JC676]MBC9034443.1 hypothetical protein [Sphingomonas sp. JC676]